jgi:hypothetical protein
LIQNLHQPVQIFGKACLSIEPQAQKALRAIDTVPAGPQNLKTLAAADEPMDAIGLQLDNEILADACPFVVALLLA